MPSNDSPSAGIGGKGGCDHGIGVVTWVIPKYAAVLAHSCAMACEEFWRP